MKKSYSLQKNIIYFVAYFVASLFFFVYLIYFLYPIQNNTIVAEAWVVPSTAPSGMYYDGSTYYVSSPQELLYTMSKSNVKKIVLIDNINLSGKTLTPFTRSSELTIDGNGYSIIGVQISRPLFLNTGYVSGSFSGLIGVLSNKLVVNEVNLIINLSVNTIQNTGYNGAFVAYASSSASIELVNCTVNGSIVSTQNGTQYNGGFIGYSAGNVILKSCINYADLKSQTGNGYFGGLVGYDNGSMSISLCGNTGSIDTFNTVGGLVGYYSSSNTISKCFNSGNLTTYSGYIGGLVGISYSGYIGGLVGISNKNYTIYNCYNTGNITGLSSKFLGAFCGNLQGCTLKVSNSYSTGNLLSNQYNNIVNSSTDISNNFNIEFSNMFYGVETYGSINSTFPITNPYFGGDSTQSKFTISSDDVSYVDGFNQEFNFGENGEVRVINSFMYVVNILIKQTVDIPLVIQYGGMNYDLGTITVSDDKVSTPDDIKNELKGSSIFGRFIETNNINISENIFVTNKPIKVYDRMLSNQFAQLNCYDTYGNNGYVTFDLSLLENEFDTSTVNSMDSMHFYGFEVEVDDGLIFLTPVFIYINSKSSNLSAPFIAKTYYADSLKICIMDINDYKVNGYVESQYITNTSIIRKKNFGDNFIVDNSLNDGYPILKDLYWMYS